jgi:hypothetical protein
MRALVGIAATSTLWSFTSAASVAEFTSATQLEAQWTGRDFSDEGYDLKTVKRRVTRRHRALIS